MAKAGPLPFPQHDLLATFPLKPRQVKLYLIDGQGWSEPFMVARTGDGKWLCGAWLARDEQNAWVIARLEVRSWDRSARHVGTEVLRSLPLGLWLTTAHRWLTTEAKRRLQEESDQSARKRLRNLERSKVPTAGPQGWGRDFYRQLALAFLEQQGKELPKGTKPRGLYQRLSDDSKRRLGRKLNVSQVRDAVHKATELQFLSPGIRGRAGREPGPLLYVKEDNL